MPRACWIDNNSVHVLSSILDKPCLVLKSCREFTRPLVRNFRSFSLKNELQSLDSTSACTFDDLLIQQNVNEDSLLMIDKLYTYVMIKGWNNLVYFKFFISGIRYVYTCTIHISCSLYISMWCLLIYWIVPATGKEVSLTYTHPFFHLIIVS